MSSMDEELVARANARLGTVLLGKYHLDRVLGIGGMATVYAATHRNGNEFAVKVLHPDLSMRSEIRTRFLREGNAASAVKHPGVVQVLDDDVAEDGSAFLVMELLRGESLESLWERRRQVLPLKLVVAIVVHLLDVLDVAHTRGIVHRDIKPANIFLTHAGQVKVLDFGIARIRDMAASQATQAGVMIGTPAFMAPEQAMARTKDIDAQTDLWAVGASMFTLASGRLVHEADNAQQLVVRAATVPAPAFDSVFADAPPLVASAIDTALAFEKAHRWPTAAAMGAALRSAASSVYGLSPTPAAIVEMIEDLGEEATVLRPQVPARTAFQQVVVRPRPPAEEPIPLDPDSSDELPTRLADRSVAMQGIAAARDGAVPSQTKLFAGAALTYAAPPPRAAVATVVLPRDSSGRAGGLSGSGSRLFFVVAAIGATVILGALIALLAFCAKTSRGAGRVGRESLTSPTAEQAASSAPPRDDPPGRDDSAATAAAPPGDTGSVAHAPLSGPVGGTSPQRKPNCNPPYVVDAQGARRWKPACPR
jgi:serine/threonine-protein kinase